MRPVTVPALLASGRTADVYLVDDRRVLRRYRAGGDVAAEAEVMRHLRGSGYPVPAVHRADGPDLVLERLVGPTLAEAYVRGDVDTTDGARLLADLHARLHALPAARSSDPDVRILHLDLHPENVVLTPAGPVVIDWANATEGPAELDTAMTALILAEVATDRDTPLSTPARELLVGYLAATGPARLLARAATLRAETGPLDAARLAEATALVRALSAG